MGRRPFEKHNCEGKETIGATISEGLAWREVYTDLLLIYFFFAYFI